MEESIVELNKDSDKSNSNLEIKKPAYIGFAPDSGGSDKCKNLNTILTKPEMAWTAGFVWRATLWDFNWRAID